MARKSYLTRGAIAAERARTRMAKTGQPPNGDPLWTERELEVVRRLYPDYRQMRRTLRKRTYFALRGAVQKLGIAKRRHRWTGADISRLRRLYPNARRAEIEEAFPDVAWNSIVKRANAFGLYRARRPFCETGDQALDAIRSRAFALNLSMVDVDALARSKRYFQTGAWHSGWKNIRAIKRATAALDGDLMPVWKRRD